MTKKELRDEYFRVMLDLRQIMLDEYARHGEETTVPDMWQELHSLWHSMNEFSKKL